MPGQAGLVEDEETIGHRMPREQLRHSCFIQRYWIPDGVGEQVLQPLDGGSCDDLGDGLARFVGEVA